MWHHNTTFTSTFLFFFPVQESKNMRWLTQCLLHGNFTLCLHNFCLFWGGGVTLIIQNTGVGKEEVLLACHSINKRCFLVFTVTSSFRTGQKEQEVWDNHFSSFLDESICCQCQWNWWKVSSYCRKLSNIMEGIIIQLPGYFHTALFLIW